MSLTFNIKLSKLVSAFSVVGLTFLAICLTLMPSDRALAQVNTYPPPSAAARLESPISASSLGWHSRVSPTPLPLLGIASSPSGFVAVPQDTNIVICSSDGSSWDQVRLSEGIHSFGAICFDEHQFVIATHRPTGLLRSPSGGVMTTRRPAGLLTSADGRVWQAVQTEGLPSKYCIFSLAHTGRLYLASTLGKTLFWSRDLAHWSAFTLPGVKYGVKYGFSYGNKNWVVPTSRGAATSQDGKTWHTTEFNGLGPSEAWCSAYGSGRFVIVTAGGQIWASGDGQGWAKVCDQRESLHGLAYGAGRFVACGHNGTILTSTDALHWARCQSAGKDFLYRVAFGQGTFVAVGIGGAIVQSDRLE